MCAKVKDGWKPLCDFLGLPVPSVPFPRVNDTPAMRRLLNSLLVASYSFAAVLIAMGMAILRYFVNTLMS